MNKLKTRQSRTWTVQEEMRLDLGRDHTAARPHEKPTSPRPLARTRRVFTVQEASPFGPLPHVIVTGKSSPTLSTKLCSSWRAPLRYTRVSLGTLTMM